MNVALMPNDVNLNFYFNSPEIYKSEEEIKQCFFNNQGSIIAIITKSNLIKMIDFLGKSCVFVIKDFKENQEIINFLSWSSDSKKIFVTYETFDKQTKIKIISIYLDESQSHKYFDFGEEIFIHGNLDLKNNNTFARSNGANFLIISGPYPKIYDLSTGKYHNIFKAEQPSNSAADESNSNNEFKISSSCNNNGYNCSNGSKGSNSKYKFTDYTFILKETLDVSTNFLFIKELSIFFLLKENNDLNSDKSNYLLNNLKEKKLNEEQLNLLEYVRDNLTSEILIMDFFSLSSNAEILHANLDSTKSLILTNSTDRILRLFNYNFDAITLIKEFSDSVNRKKWINAFFYSFKIKSNFQEIIVSALSDANSLEFIFIDINTGKFIKNMEPFKYQCSDFICHYSNHYSIVLISNKKLFHIYGYLMNNFGALAPQFQYMEENIEYVEEEDFFDQFKKNFKSMQNKKKERNKAAIMNSLLRSSNKEGDNKSVFFFYNPVEEDALALQSEKELKELFQNFNDLIEINIYDNHN